MMKKSLHAALTGAVLANFAACSTPPPPHHVEPDELAAAIERSPVVILGETHDNAAAHRVRLEALQRVFDDGKRPAIAFEQLDQQRQIDIDELRAHAPPGTAVADLAARIAALGDRGWNWDFYRPYIRLALDYDVPIVAADLSRTDAMTVAEKGYQAIFPPDQRAALDRLTPSLMADQVEEIEAGHCHTLAYDQLAPIARAQIARDGALAHAIAPYAERGVVLLTGNGHARRDIGVERHLDASLHAESIGLIEDDGHAGELPKGAYDLLFTTPVQKRPDPCLALQKQKAKS